MALTREQVLHLAELARLQLSEEEVSRYQQELSSILGYVEKLSELPTADVEPTAQVGGLANVAAADALELCAISADDLLARAARRAGRYLEVPSVLAHRSVASELKMKN